MPEAETPAKVIAASEAFAAAVVAEGVGDRCRDILLDALGTCESASQVAAVFKARGIDEVVFGTSPMWPQVAEVLVARAQAMPTPDDAQALGWLATLSSPTPTLIVSPQIYPALRWDERRSLVAAVEGHMDLYRRWSGDPVADRRVAGGHLLAWCSNVTTDDAAALLDASSREGNGAALATDLLTLGVMHHRLRFSGEALRTFATGCVGADDPLVRLCASVALALLGDPLAEDAMRALVDHLAEPIALPAPWQWTVRAGPCTSKALALAVLAWAPTRAPEPVLRRLAAAAIDLARPQLDPAYAANLPPGIPANYASRPARMAIGGAMLRLAFEGRGRPVPRRGLAVSELDPMERLTLQTLVEIEVPWPAYGIKRAESLADYLSGATLEWRPIGVVVAGSEQSWHFARIAAAVAQGELDPIAARDAVLREPLADVADLATRWSSGRTLLDQTTPAADERARVLELCLSIVTALPARGFDMDALYRAAPSNYATTSQDVGILAIACLRAHPGELPEDFIPLVACAISQGWWAEPLLEQVRRLSPASRRAALRAVSHLTPSALPFFSAVELDPTMVKTLVLHACQGRGQSDVPAVIELFAKGGPPVAAMLEAIEYPDAASRALAAPFVREVLEELRAR